MPDAPAGRVLVVGDLLVDVVARPAGPLRVGSDTAAEVRLTGGGSAANTAAWIAHAGGEVALLAAVGEDELGAVARRDLAAAGVAFVGPVLADRATGTCVVIVAPDGERTMLPDRGANDALPAAAVDAALAGAAWVHVSGYALLHEGSRSAGVAALAGARARGVPTSVDAASAGPLADVGAAVALALLAGVDVLFANAAELAALGGLDATLAAGIGAVVAKAGADGATWTDGVSSVAVPAAPAEVVDTTGAGDALAAGFLAATRAGADRPAALEAGVALAAHAVARLGARP
ncbi:MAG TPA: PfkB family carbohydrate kinase [Iamia sp.]|nr:PfkB family carbohydrate kinase [Iamia sp.]